MPWTRRNPPVKQNSKCEFCGLSALFSSYKQVLNNFRPCIHRLFPCGVCPFSLVTRHTDNEHLLCFNGYNMDTATKLKKRFISCVVCHKGTLHKGTAFGYFVCSHFNFLCFAIVFIWLCLYIEFHVFLKLRFFCTISCVRLCSAHWNLCYMHYTNVVMLEP